MQVNSRSKALALSLAILMLVGFLPYSAEGLVQSKKITKTAVKNDDTSYKIGLIAPLTENNTSQGDLMKKGFILAIEQAEAKAGNYAVKYVIEDDKSNKSVAALKGKKLIQTDKVQTLIGSSSYDCTNAISEIANAESVPFIAPVTSWPYLTGDGKRRNDYTF